jgi:virginiamycin A acetyltransferase
VMGSRREILKAVVRAAATALVSPAFVSFWVASRLLGPDRALQDATQGLSLLPGLSGRYLRTAFLRRTLEYCHPSVTIEFGTTFSKIGARLEENVYVGPMCHIGLAHIGRDSLLASGVQVPSGPRVHGIDDSETPIRDQRGQLTVVRIGAGAWIGCGAIVMADVGEGTVVGAGSVVSRPLPPLVIAAGVPALIKKSRSECPRRTEGQDSPMMPNGLTG